MRQPFKADCQASPVNHNVQSMSANPSDQLRMIFRGCFLAVVLGFLAGCATESYAPDSAPEFIVTREYTPFYLVGPMQVNGPDGSLPTNTRVKVLKKEMGYYLVLLDDKRTGYVAGENLAPAPPLPPPPAADNSSGGKKRRGAGTGPKYTGEQNNDIPLPDPNVPPPDLNVAPEEVPASAPTPTPEKPKFRY